MAFACLTLLAVNIAGVEFLFSKNLKKSLGEITTVQDEFLETYLADIEFLERSDLASTLARNIKEAATATEDVDAGRVLNKLVQWTPRSDFGRKDPLVPAKSREFLMRYDDDWIKGRTFVERGSVKADLSFLDGIENFKIWDIEKNSPLAALVDRGEFVLPSRLPVPETLDLVTVVKVRLIQGSYDGKPLEALRQVRQFATLLLTTENTQLVLAGLSSLDLERRAYREYVDREWIDAAAWLPIDRNTSMRASRAFNATAGYMRAITSEETFNRVFAEGKIPPGLCAAANEQLPAEYAYRDQLTGWWPLERGYRQGFKRLDRVLEMAEKHCRLRLLKKLKSENAFRDIAPEAPWPLVAFPYFRTLFALRDWTAWPKHFDGYSRR